MCKTADLTYVNLPTVLFSIHITAETGLKLQIILLVVLIKLVEQI